MEKVTIYRFSKNPRYENTYDHRTWFQVTEPVDDDEFYLFREVWKLDSLGYYQSMIDNDFIKIVSKKWLEERHLYYGCRVLNDSDTDDLTEYATEYAKETQNMI